MLWIYLELETQRDRKEKHVQLMSLCNPDKKLIFKTVQMEVSGKKYSLVRVLKFCFFFYCKKCKTMLTHFSPVRKGWVVGANRAAFSLSVVQLCSWCSVILSAILHFLF